LFTEDLIGLVVVSAHRELGGKAAGIPTEKPQQNLQSKKLIFSLAANVLIKVFWASIVRFAPGIRV
jgi:hypothetical protein